MNPHVSATGVDSSRLTHTHNSEALLGPMSNHAKKRSTIVSGESPPSSMILVLWLVFRILAIDCHSP